MVLFPHGSSLPLLIIVLVVVPQRRQDILLCMMRQAVEVPARGKGSDENQ